MEAISLPGQVVDDASSYSPLTMPLQQWRHTQQAQLTDQWQLAGAQRQPGDVTIMLWRHIRQPPIIAARYLPTMTSAYVTVTVPEIEVNKFIDSFQRIGLFRVWTVKGLLPLH